MDVTHHGCTQIENSIFKGNRAGIGGGLALSSMVGNYNCTNSIVNSSFTKNIARTIGGGAIHINNRYVNVSATSASQNGQDWIYTSKETNTNIGILYINDSTFTSNIGEQFGGIGISRE